MKSKILQYAANTKVIQVKKKSKPTLKQKLMLWSNYLSTPPAGKGYHSIFEPAKN